MAGYSQNSFSKPYWGHKTGFVACTLYVICEGPQHTVIITEKRNAEPFALILPFFVLKMLSAFYVSFGSSLIRVHTVCNIGYLRI